MIEKTNIAEEAQSKALKIVREVHRMKQGQLADALGISKSYLSELERGEKKVSIEVLNKYAHAFDVPASTFLSFMEALEGQSEVRQARAKKLLSVLEWTLGNDLAEDKNHVRGQEEN